jgi:hypothetical protein
MPAQQQAVLERQQEILDLVRELCAKKLDDEYFAIWEIGA